MARESCNLDKDEAEILKPSSSSASPPPPPPSPPAAASSPPGLFLKPPQDHPIQRPETPAASSGFTQFKDPRVQSGNKVSIGNSLKSGSAHKRKVEEIEQPMDRSVNRCFSCRKKVGLTGFKCRCGSLFCARHRYSDAHECSFDYKAAGREEIAKANPVIRAAKIIKI